jgi:predicted nucleic acid-binding protein
MYLLDTNVVSELRKAPSGRADANVIAWAASVTTPMLFLSSITILEMEIGILQIERQDSAQGALLRDWLESQVLTAFDGRIIAFDRAAARRCAALLVPDRISDREAMIAAIALIHGLRVVTRKTADFADTGAPLLNPWEPSRQ